MSRVILDAVCFSLAVWVDESDGDEIFIRINRVPVSYGQRLVRDGVLNGAPDVDETYARLEESLSIFAQVPVDALDAGFRGLVDMDPFLCE